MKKDLTLLELEVNVSDNQQTALKDEKKMERQEGTFEYAE